MSWFKRLSRYIRITAAVGGLSMAASCSGGQERDPETYLIPEGYAGSFYIVFNIPSGEPQAYEDGARVYDIPEDGVLLVQSDSNTGVIRSDKINFFYKSEDGTRAKIDGRWTTSLHDTPENRADEDIYVFGGGIGGIEPVRHCKIYTADFYVATKSQALEDEGHFDIYSDRGIGNMPPEIFLEACEGSR